MIGSTERAAIVFSQLTELGSIEADGPGDFRRAVLAFPSSPSWAPLKLAERAHDAANHHDFSQLTELGSIEAVFEFALLFSLGIFSQLTELGSIEAGTRRLLPLGVASFSQLTELGSIEAR